MPPDSAAKWNIQHLGMRGFGSPRRPFSLAFLQFRRRLRPSCRVLISSIVRALLIILRNERFAIPLDNVREVVASRPLAAIPRAQPPVLGAMNLRGSVLAAVDPEPIVPLTESPFDEIASEPSDYSFVVIDHPRASLAIRVRRVESIYSFGPESISEISKQNSRNGGRLVVSSTAQLASGETVKVIDVNGLLNALSEKSLQFQPSR